MKLIFAPEVKEDMDNIYYFYAQYNQPYAVELYNRFIEEAENLLKFPKMAQIEDLLSEYPEKYRSLVVQNNYKLVYFVENDTINIVAVFDCRQNPEKLKKDIAKFSEN
jgi:plasmid stabilization system protein ParE